MIEQIPFEPDFVVAGGGAGLPSTRFLLVT